MALERFVPEHWYAIWPPDDTEESIFGSDCTSSLLPTCGGASMRSRAEAGRDRPVHFQAVSQTTLLGLRRRGKTAMRAMPDVCIF